MDASDDGEIVSRPPHDGRGGPLDGLLDDFARVCGLSPRERAVIGLAALAVHDKEIAAQLGVSVKTVEVFWRRIYEKTGARGHNAVLAAIIWFAAVVSGRQP